MEKTIEGYADRIRGQVEERLGSGYAVQVRKVTKNNGVALTGLVVQKEGEKVSPTVYLDGYYGEGREDAAEEIAAFCIMPAPFRGMDVPGRIGDAGFARERVCYRLVNRKRNRGQLKGIPHRDLLDLCVTYFIPVDAGGSGQGTIQVTDALAGRWGMDEEELHEMAGRNTPRIFPAESGSLADVVRGMGVPLAEGGEGLRIITNKARLYGAAAILYEGVLEAEAKAAGGDIYVIPSSVHEALVMRTDAGMEAGEIASMTREINETTVAPEEVLSDSLYIYRRGRGLEKAREE